MDPLKIFSSPEFHTYLENNILRPILAKIFNYLYPYILGFTILWVIMLLSIIIVIVMLLRAKH
jgi:hypothetical protein